MPISLFSLKVVFSVSEVYHYRWIKALSEAFNKRFNIIIFNNVLSYNLSFSVSRLFPLLLSELKVPGQLSSFSFLIRSFLSSASKYSAYGPAGWSWPDTDTVPRSPCWPCLQQLINGKLHPAVDIMNLIVGFYLSR